MSGDRLCCRQRHFSAVAENGRLPVILYNIPGRCGVPIAVETVVRLSENKNIIAVKEAGGSVERVSSILAMCNIIVLSGDDSLTIPMMPVGAKGIISVVSNIVTREIKQMVDAFASGDSVRAMKLHVKLYPLFRDMFIETNPIPIKAAMSEIGLVKEEYRLPLCPMGEKNRKILLEAMKKSGIL